MPDAVSGVIVPLIGGIFTIRNSPLHQKVLYLPSLQAQDGPDDPVPYRQNTCQPPDAASPEQMEQLCLAAVIAVVRYCDLRCAPFCGHFVECLISCAAPRLLLRAFFPAGPVPDICLRQEKRKVPVSTDGFHIPGILSRLCADAVIHMYHRNIQLIFLLPFQQQK